jgi:hypothetical protein
VRQIYTPFAGLLTLFALLFVVSGCEDAGSGSSSGFSFDGGFVPFDATLPPVADASGPPPETTLTLTPAALSNEANAKFEFTSNQPGFFACRIDEGAPSECSSPHIVPVSEGVHTFVVAAVAATGVDLTPATFTWTVDQTPPKTTITKSPPATDNSVAVTFEFTATEDATFTCVVDDKAGAPCSSPFSVADLADGSHTVTISAKDQAGNGESPPATHSWTVDTSTPDTIIDGGPTGTVSAKTATFAFSSPNAGAGATYACSLDAAAFATCTSPFTKIGLIDGVHTFRVRASDTANNQDITPAERTWTVDTVPPTVTITGGPTGPINDAAPIFTFTTGGAESTQCRFDANPFASCTSPFTPVPALGQGAHTFTVRAFDAASNFADATRSFSVDTLAPSVTITGGPTGPTNDTTPTFTFTTSGGATGTACRVDGAPFTSCTSPFTSAVLADATHTFDVRVTDAAGNVATASRSFTVDTIAPTVTITGGPNGPTNDATPTFTFTMVGATSTACRIVPNAFVACASPFTAAALGDGPYTFEVRAIDAALNPATATQAFTVDTALPSIVINSGPIGPTNDATPTFTFTAGMGAVATTCRIDAEAFAACTSPFTPAVALGQGAHTFDVHAIDAASNFATASRSFVVDTIAPSVTITTGPTGPTADRTPTFDFTVTGATTIQCRIDTQPFTTCSASYTPPTALIDGKHTFAVRATDAATNATTATRAFSVDGTGPAVTITAGPTGLTNNATPTFDFVVSDVSAPITIECRLDSGAFAACTSPHTLILSPRTAQGLHTFTVQATDALGNVGSASRSFTLDTIGPAVNITAGPTSTAAQFETFTFSKEAGSVTECRILSGGLPYTNFVPCDAPTTTVQMPPPGTYQFEIRATDAAGNTNSAFWNFSTYIIG